MKLKDIKVKDKIQVFKPELLSVELYEVYDIYHSEYGGFIFECFKVKFTPDKKMVLSDFTDFVFGKNVLGTFENISK